MDSDGCYSDIDDRRTALQNELNTGRRLDGGVKFLQQAFSRVTSRRVITQFLAQSKSYDIKRKTWRILPQACAVGTELSLRVHKLLKEVFKYPKFHNHDRKLVCCLDCEIDPRRDDLCAHEQDPTFMILGRRGLSFEEQQFPTAPTFSQCVSFIKVVASCSPRNLQSDITLMATYARQCFIDQHNRLKVYAVLLTGSTMWLIQYDRSGITYSSSCDIHDDPHTFIRIILGIASDEAQVGFDTGIFWEKGKRWMRVRNQKGRRVVYLVKGNRPIDNRQVIVGRATRCWRVIDPYTNKEYVLKEIWRLVGDKPEVDLLEAVRGLTGVGQLIAVEEDPAKTTASFRGCSPAHALPTDRIWCRITLEAYGGCLYKFSDGLQLLEAYKDIVLAILGLWEQGILHRDISVNNALLGKDRAPPGNRGVLIDFDRATRIDTPESRAGATSNIGTRTFQSISVLRSDDIRQDAQLRHDTIPEPYPHDHFDDMESLFYVLCWVCYQYDSPGCPNGEILDTMVGWDKPDPDLSAGAKMEFLSLPLPSLSPYFQRGSAYPHLLENLKEMVSTIAGDKRRGTWRVPPGDTLKDTYKDARQDFMAFVGHIDQAIEEWKAAPEAHKTSSTNTTAHIATNSADHAVQARSEQQTSQGAKRTHIDDQGGSDEPSPKRRKTVSRPKHFAKVPTQKQASRMKTRS